MNRLFSRVLMGLAVMGSGTPSGFVSAQVSDSLAYLEMLHEDAMLPDDLPDDREQATEAAGRNSIPSGTGALSWHTDIAISGRFALNATWSPREWLEISGSVLREAAEPVRLDPGTQWFIGEHSTGFVRFGGRRLRLILGDFRFRSAGALSSPGMRTSEPSRQYPSRGVVRIPDVRPYSGNSQQPAPRGMALFVTPATGWALNLFTSARKEDGQTDVITVPGSAPCVSLRKSWRLTTASSLMSRRRVRLASHGGSLSLVRDRVSAGVSWTRFFSTRASRSVFESMGIWKWSSSNPGYLAASFGFAPTDLRPLAWSIEAAAPVSDMLVTFFHRREQPDAATPWGPDVRMDNRNHVRQTTSLSVGTRHLSGIDMVWGFRYHRRTPSGVRQALDRQVAVWIHAERRTWVVELRMRHNEDPFRGIWSGRTRMSIRKEMSAGPNIRIRLHAVAARAGGLAARLQWQAYRHTRFVIGRTAVWGNDSDPWAVLVTDRMTGTLGLLRMTGPTLHWSLRVETVHTDLGRVTFFLDQRVQRTTFTGTRAVRRSIVLALRN